jgi:solute carrier family 25 (mitochondrial carnitine/acylcarnitine transporter), member 20/29
MALTVADGPYKSAFFGIVGGLTNAISTHPLDTIKTRIQTGQSLKSACFSGSLIRGLLAPVLSVPPAWVANFLTFSFALQLTGDSTTLQHATAGSLSGIVWAISVSPFELVKCIAQKENISSFEVWKRSSNDKNARLNLTRGIGVAICRDCVGLAMWFGMYHKAQTEWECSHFSCGVLAASSAWIACFPIDTLKTRYQTERGTSLSESYRSLRSEVTKSPIRMFKPLPVILLRAGLGTGISMQVVGWVRESIL